MKHVYNKKKVDTSKYVNIETGQPLSDEMPNITSMNIKNNDKGLVDYKSYIMINDEAMEVLKIVLSDTDFAKLIHMSRMVQGDWNILTTKDMMPHDRNTLAVDLNIAPQNVSKLITKFVKKGILYQLKGYYNNSPTNCIILNPYIARKRKTFAVKCLHIFQQFKFSDDRIYEMV